MLGIKTRLPIEVSDAEMIYAKLAELRGTFPELDFRTYPSLMPKRALKETRFDGSEQSCQRLAASIRATMGIEGGIETLFLNRGDAEDAVRVKARSTPVEGHWESRGVAGIYYRPADGAPGSESAQVAIDLERFAGGTAESLVATLAHEFAHHKLLYEKGLGLNDEEATGVLAGDLLDDMRLPDDFLIAELGLQPDELLEDLAGADDERPWETAVRRFAAINLRGLEVLEGRFKEVLASARKPVVLVPGNHDETEWADGENVSNVHGRRLDIDGWNFVGYRWTSDDRSEERMAGELAALAPLVDRRSVLLTHNPCEGILDGTAGHSEGSGALRALIKERRPSWHLFGHVHEAHGRRGRSVNDAYPRARAFFDIDLGRRKLVKVVAATDYPNPRWA